MGRRRGWDTQILAEVGKGGASMANLREVAQDTLLSLGAAVTRASGSGRLQPPSVAGLGAPRVQRRPEAVPECGRADGGGGVGGADGELLGPPVRGEWSPGSWPG